MTRDARIVGAVALAARLAVVSWAASAIPPTADGSYYHTLATRLAAGQGYTWAWPDGAVTYAAHYPVGYPALVALGYLVFGAKPAVAMLMNAALGTAAALATHDVLARATRPKLALAGGLVAALHPALLPYTAAIMTEGATASLLAIALACADRGTWRWIVACGLAMGVATLVRPQSLALAPILGWLAMRREALALPSMTLRGRRARAASALLVTLLALAVCAPWTARNCERMNQCALVSVNGGWNLAIGTQTTDGGWHEMKVPDACKEVFAEAAKDACFGREAVGVIVAQPGAWIARAPAKLRATFDYIGAAPWYLHAANPVAFPYKAKIALGAFETLAVRLLLVAALVAVMKAAGPRALARKGVAIVGLVACVLAPGAFAYVALGVAILLLGLRAIERASPLVGFAGLAVLVTAATHATFFGSGRYGLVVLPFVAAIAFVRSGERGLEGGDEIRWPVAERAREPAARVEGRGELVRRHDASLRLG